MCVFSVSHVDIDFEPPVMIAKSNSFSDANTSTASDQPEMNSPSPAVTPTPNEKTPERPMQVRSKVTVRSG